MRKLDTGLWRDNEFNQIEHDAVDMGLHAKERGYDVSSVAAESLLACMMYEWCAVIVPWHGRGKWIQRIHYLAI